MFTHKLYFLFVIVCTLTLSSGFLINKPNLSALKTFNILDYGAKGDGNTSNTCAINMALMAAQQNGGGIVLVPQGRFVSGAFQVTGQNIYLQVEGELYATDDASQYYCLPSVTSDTGPCDYPFIAVLNGNGIGIFGSGSINGGANSPPGHLVEKYLPDLNFLVPSEWKLPNCTGYSCRPKLLVINNCTNAMFKSVSLLNSPLWTVTLIASHYVEFDGVKIIGDKRWPNNDGIDPISGSHITIKNSKIIAGDDCICLITHTHEDIHDVLVEDCEFESSSAALKVSAFESTATGSIFNVMFRNSKISDTNRGLAIMPRWGTGQISQVVFANITMETHYFSNAWWGSAEPIYITSIDSSTTHFWTGDVFDIKFHNITARSENGIVIRTQQGKKQIQNLFFDQVRVTIDKFSNISNPMHDWRPSPPPEVEACQVDGFYMDNVDYVIIADSSVTYTQPLQPFYGECLNRTASVHHLVVSNLVCNE